MKEQFFKAKTVDEFLDLALSFPAITRVEAVAVFQSAGRVLAEDITAEEDLPLFSRASMDGYAVRARDTFGASEGSPAYLEIIGRVEIETPPTFAVGSEQCAEMVTGGTMPKGADSVVMVEHSHVMGAGTVEVRRSVAPQENVILAGEDAQAGSVVLTKGTRVRVQDVGLLAAMGVSQVKVVARPRVFILSTGNEIVAVAEKPKPGQIRDVNMPALAALVLQAGGEPILGPIVRDETKAIVQALNQGLAEADLVLVSGGSSVGTRDLTIEALEQLLDAELLAHGVMMKPGKPNILCRAAGKPVWGLPGQVTSAQVSMMIFGLPLLRHLGGETGDVRSNGRRIVSAKLGRNISSRIGVTEFVRVKLSQGPDGLPVAMPVTGKSGLLKTLIQGDGLVTIPAGSEGIEAGEMVQVELF